MRMNRTWRNVALWTWGVLLFFFALAPEALAGDQLQLASSWAAPATVLGLTLIAAARQRH
jgi:hypothetical protein